MAGKRRVEREKVCKTWPEWFAWRDRGKVTLSVKKRLRCPCGAAGRVQQEVRTGTGVFYRWYCMAHRPRRGPAMRGGRNGDAGGVGELLRRMAGI